MAATLAASQALPPPPRATGDPATDALTNNDYLSDLYNSLTAPFTGLDPTSLPDPSTATLASAQATANAAYNFCIAINDALAQAAIAGFPVTPPTS